MILNSIGNYSCKMETELSEWSETLGHLVKSTPWYISFAIIDISAKYCLPFYFKIENKWKKENLQIDYICDHGKLCAHQSESKGLYKMWWAVSLYFHLLLSDPIAIGLQKNFIFILTIFHYQVIKCLFPGGIGSSMLVLFSLVEHFNLAYILRFLLFYCWCHQWNFRG